MRSSSILAFAAACAATLGPFEAKSAGVHALTGIPRLSFSTSGAQLTRNLAVSVDDTLFAIDVSAPFCAQAQAVGVASAAHDAANCATGRGASASWLGEHEASATLKIPQWQADAPYVDVSLRTWRADVAGDASRTSLQGTAAEFEITQALGRHDIVAGYSHPIGVATIDGWRTAWAGAILRVSPNASLRLSYESARDDRGARDSRYIVRYTHSIADSVRMTAYIVNAPDDIERRWRAGVGVDWTF